MAMLYGTFLSGVACMACGAYLSTTIYQDHIPGFLVVGIILSGGAAIITAMVKFGNPL